MKVVQCKLEMELVGPERIYYGDPANVTVKVTNVGALQHDFQIKGRKTRLLSHGKSATLRVTFLRKGTYPYKCTVAGHAAAGMKGVFTIT